MNADREQRWDAAATLIVAAFTSLALWILANGVVSHLAVRSLPRQLLAESRQTPRINVLVAGNSVVREGFDKFAFDRAAGADAVGFNAGLGGTTELEHLLLVKAVLGMHPEIRQLIYGFFDFHLTQPFVSRWWVAEGNAALDFYVERSTAERYLTRGGWPERLLFRTVANVPFFVERMALWSKVERVRRWLAQLGMPGAIPNSQGRTEDFEQLTARSGDEFQGEARRRLEQKWPLSRPLEELFQRCRELGIQVTVVAMPMPPRHRERFYSLEAWKEYLTHVRGLLQARGIEFLDATPWVSEPGKFNDAVHLNRAGAAEFSARLAHELAKTTH